MSRTYDNLKRRRRTDGSEEPPAVENLELFAFAEEKEKVKEKEKAKGKKKPVPAASPAPPPPPPPPPPPEPEPEFGGPTRSVEPFEEPVEEQVVSEELPREEPAAEEEPLPVAEEAAAPEQEPEPAPEPEAVPEEQPVEPAAQEEPQLELEAPFLQPGRPLRPGGISPLTGRPLRQPPAPSNSGVLVGAGVVLVAVLVIAALYGMVKSIARAVSKKPAPVAQVARVAPPAAPVVMSFETPKPVARTVETPRTSRPPAGAPALGAQGVKVTVEGRVQIVVFEEGVFEGGLKLSRGGERQLSTLAGQMAPFGKNLAVTVIGCTDNVKLSPKSKYKDNRELGLLRAAAVVRFLETDGLPGGAFQTMSFGTQWSPYPNDTPENRARNRTVVLRVSVRK